MSVWLLLAAAALAPTDAAALDAAVLAIYRPYQHPANTPTAWERPIFSAETTALIARWRAVAPEDEPDDLSDGDWLCLCQDWDLRRFRATVVSRQIMPDGRADIAASIDLGFGEPRQARLLLAREDGAWKLDDLFAVDFPRGLKQALRETIAVDQAR